MTRRHKAYNVYGDNIDVVERAIEDADAATDEAALVEMSESFLGESFETHGGPRYTGSYEVD